MIDRNLVIINNEKISRNENIFYCDNVDMKSIPEELNKHFNVTLIARCSKIKRSRQINLLKIKNSLNILSFFSNIIETFKKKILYI